MTFSFRKLFAGITSAALLLVSIPTLSGSSDMVTETQSQWTDSETLRSSNISSGESLAFDVSTNWEGNRFWKLLVHLLVCADTTEPSTSFQA